MFNKDRTAAPRGRRSFLKAGAATAATTAAVGTSLVMGQQAASADPFSPVYLPITPTRIYDSRQGLGRINGGQTRTLVGAPADYDWAFCFNVTVTDTVGSGWLALYMAGETWGGASTLGWSGPGQGASNNALTEVRASDVGFTIRCGGVGQTQVIIDVVAVITIMDLGSMARARANGDDSVRWNAGRTFEWHELS